MMEYEEFKRELVGQLRSCLSREGSGVGVFEQPVQRVNCVEDAITFLGLGVSVSPIVYVKSAYEAYKGYGDFQGVLNQVLETLKIPIEEPEISLELVKHNVVFQLINAEQNEALLDGVPYHKFLDLAVIYRCVLELPQKQSDCCSSFIITNGFADMYSLCEGDLYNLAMENTIRLFPPKIELMDNMIAGMFPERNLPHLPLPIYILTNDFYFRGANMIIYEHLLFMISQKEHRDLYILPSSIHEVLIVPAIDSDYASLKDMVESVNLEVIRPEERLSDNVYYYNMKKGKIIVCGKD